MKLPQWIKDLIDDFPPYEREDLTIAFQVFILDREDKAWDACNRMFEKDWEDVDDWRKSKEYQND